MASNIGVQQETLSVSSDPIEKCKEVLLSLDNQQQLNVISALFNWFTELKQLPIHLPSDFLNLVIDAMCHLHQCNRSNVVYLIAKGFGTMREDNSDSIIPARRMPMGLIEYIAKFFTAASIQQVYLKFTQNALLYNRIMLY